MALFLETRDMFPSFKESALRSSAPPQPLEPRVTISASSLLYPDTALRTAWRLRRRSSTPKTPYARPLGRANTPPPSSPASRSGSNCSSISDILASSPGSNPLPGPHSIPLPVEPISIPVASCAAAAPVFTYPTPPHESSSSIHMYLDKYRLDNREENRQTVHTHLHGQEPGQPQMHLSQKPPLSPPVSPNMSPSDPVKVCISCKSSQSPCWRPSWSQSAGQLCNSCGLRYKKTGARCVSSQCGKIPSKGEWSTMNKNAIEDSNGQLQYACLQCNSAVELRA